jgi:hypothetical protein
MYSFSKKGLFVHIREGQLLSVALTVTFEYQN